MGGAKRLLEEYQSRGFGPLAGSMCASHIRDEFLLKSVIPARTSGVCFICGIENEDQVEADALLAEMVDVATEGLSAPDGPYVQTIDTADLFWRSFHDLFDVDDPTEIFEYLLASDNTFEWAVPFLDSLYDDDEETWRSPSEKWRIFKELVQHQARFVFLTGASRLPEQGAIASDFVAYFNQILQMYEASIVRDLTAGTVMFRGRMVASLDDGAAFTSVSLGPAPNEKAAANRMSPAGISMFYGSEQLDTAVAEIAAHDAQQREYAVVGGFELLRDVRVVDLVDIEVPSVFDHSRREERSSKLFLESFARDLSRPIRLDGQEHREYAPTQILTEAIRWSSIAGIDGIRYRSAQNEAPTCVLFFGPGDVCDLPQAATEQALGLASGKISRVRVKRRTEIELLPKNRVSATVPQQDSAYDEH